MNVVHFPLLLLTYFTANSSLLVRDLGRWSHWLRSLPSKACLKLMEPIQNWLQPSHDALYLTHKRMNDSCLPELCQERFRKKKKRKQKQTLLFTFFQLLLLSNTTADKNYSLHCLI